MRSACAGADLQRRGHIAGELAACQVGQRCGQAGGDRRGDDPVAVVEDGHQPGDGIARLDEDTGAAARSDDVRTGHCQQGRGHVGRPRAALAGAFLAVQETVGVAVGRGRVGDGERGGRLEQTHLPAAAPHAVLVFVQPFLTVQQAVVVGVRVAGVAGDAGLVPVAQAVAIRVPGVPEGAAGRLVLHFVGVAQGVAIVVPVVGIGVGCVGQTVAVDVRVVELVPVPQLVQRGRQYVQIEGNGRFLDAIGVVGLRVVAGVHFGGALADQRAALDNEHEVVDGEQLQGHVSLGLLQQITHL